MSVNTSTSTITTSSTTSSAQSSSSAKSSQAVENQDFSKELENASKTETQQETEKTETELIKDNSTESEANTSNSEENSTQNSQQQNSLQGFVNKDAIFNQDTELTTINKSDILTQNIQELLNTKNQMFTHSSMLKDNVKPSVDYQTINMTEGDALFFANLVENTDMTMQSIASQIQKGVEANVEGIEQKTQISAVLLNTIKEGLKTNQPFRIDFDKDISVVIRIDKDGSVSANFIPGDKAVEQYLRNNIGFLKQRFDEENLSYKELSYSQSKHQDKERNQQRKDKENE